MLTTLLAPTSGILELDGHDPRKNAHQARRQFGIVFQDPSVDGELTAGENMELHGIFYTSRARYGWSVRNNCCGSSIRGSAATMW